MEIIEVNGSKKYNIIVGKRILKGLGLAVAQVVNSSRAIIITDDIVNIFYGDIAKKSLEKENFRVDIFVIPHGEKSKSPNVYIEILNFLAKNKVDKSAVIIALGGGVVGDLAGFIAGTYLRGIDFVQVPTTLLGAVDSSIGGKTAIDLEWGKNLVGMFYQPKLVFFDSDTFHTLSKKYLLDGWAEVIKYGAIQGGEFFEAIKSTSQKFLKEDIDSLIIHSMNTKKDIVSQDERDNNIRQILNFGHTIGHSLEVLSGFKLSHGMAVAKGMAFIAYVSYKKNWCIERDYNELIECLNLSGFDLTIPYNTNEIYEVIQQDKKVSGDNINLIIMKNIGEVGIYTMSLLEFKQLLEEYLEEFKAEFNLRK